MGTDRLNKLLRDAVVVFAEDLEVDHAMQEQHRVEWAQYNLPINRLCTVHYANHSVDKRLAAKGCDGPLTHF
eukprot:4412143-Amphidinium_carterae.1